MNKDIESIMTRFTEKLLDINTNPKELDRLNSVTSLTQSFTNEIAELQKKRGFAEEQEEIEFFKQINPKILAPSIEESVKYNIIINKPINTNEYLIDYYEKSLKSLQEFFAVNNFHYQYYKNGLKELDQIYFLRKSETVTIPILDVPPQFNEFCPPMSFLFAKFSAYENGQRYILEQISGLKISNLVGSLPAGNDTELEIKWTGEVINIVELAYGLWLTGQLNNGNASLNQIVKWLEKNLSVKIGIPQRKFSEISRRKKISVTKYIDQMRDSVLKKIDADFE